MDRDGKLLRVYELPAIGTVPIGFDGKRTDTETFFTFTNFVTPATVYRLDMKSMETTVYRQPKLAFDPARFETRQVFYTSKDGTRVPMFLTLQEGELKLDGQNPTLLYALWRVQHLAAADLLGTLCAVDGDGRRVCAGPVCAAAASTARRGTRRA